MTPLRLIRQKRILRALEILKTERVTMLELALRVGFVSPSHFARVFRSVIGRNPSEYRRDPGRSRERQDRAGR